MSIQTKLARVIEANRISGVKAYGEGEYVGGGVGNARVQELMAQSVKHGRELDKLLAQNWVTGFDKFIGQLAGDQESDEWWDYYQRKGQE